MLEQRSAWQVTRRSFFERQSLVLFFIATLIALVSYLVDRTAQISLPIALFVLGVMMSSIWVLVSALRSTLDETQTPLPRALMALTDTNAPAGIVLLLEPSELFAYSTMVSIFHRDSTSGFEVLIGHGTVLTVQSDHKIQVTVEEWLPGNETLVASVAAAQAMALNALIIRPSISRTSRTSSISEEDVEIIQQKIFQNLARRMRELEPLESEEDADE